MECLVTVKGFTGTTDHRFLETIYSDVRCRLGSARSEVAAFYENVPVGQLYEFMITDDRLSGIADGAEMTVTHPQSSGLVKGQVFIVQARTQRQRLGGRNLILGTCYLRE